MMPFYATAVDDLQWTNHWRLSHQGGYICLLGLIHVHEVQQAADWGVTEGAISSNLHWKRPVSSSDLQGQLAPAGAALSLHCCVSVMEYFKGRVRYTCIADSNVQSQDRYLHSPG